MERLDILERKEDILQWIKEGQSKAYMSVQLNCKQSTLNNYLEKMGIKYDGRQDWNKGKTNPKYVTAKEYANKDYVSSNILKQKMIRDGIKEAKCEICGLTQWLDKPIPLELHHKNFNHYDNDFSNLQILCPNCHALQKKDNDTKEEQKVNKKICPICKTNLILQNSIVCSDCYHKQQRVVERPNRTILKELIRTKSFTAIGRQFGVSDNAIRKWCIQYGLPSKVKDIKQYTDEEWLNI